MRCVTGNSTGSSIPARPPLATIKHLVTPLSCISRSAFTTVAVGKLDAVVRPSGVTRVGQAFIDVALTAFANVTRWAQTLVASDAIYTLSIVEAFGLIRKWVAGRVAVIQINFTVDALCSSRTGAFIGVYEVDAGASILAGLRLAFIDLF